MSAHCRSDWRERLGEVVRSRHYTWLGEGLGGEPLDEAVVTLMADLMHICHCENHDFEMLLAQARVRCEQEEIGHRFNRW